MAHPVGHRRPAGVSRYSITTAGSHRDDPNDTATPRGLSPGPARTPAENTSSGAVHWIGGGARIRLTDSAAPRSAAIINVARRPG
jgi:hypothetical protein